MEIIKLVVILYGVLGVISLFTVCMVDGDEGSFPAIFVRRPWYDQEPLSFAEKFMILQTALIAWPLFWALFIFQEKGTFARLRARIH